MFKTPLAALAAVTIAIFASIAPASANSHCRSTGPSTRPGSCAEAMARATIGKVRTVHRTVYVEQVRDIYRVRNVYRAKVVHARQPRPQPVRVAVHPATSTYPALAKVMPQRVVHYGIGHPHWVPNGVTHCNCGSFAHPGYHHSYYPHPYVYR